MKTPLFTAQATLNRWLLGLVMAMIPFVAGTQVGDPSPIPGVPVRLQAGQAATLMAEGAWLLTGGSQARSGATLYSGTNRTPQALPALGFGRAFHSATVMPSGEILIHGGLDASGKLVTRDEFFDPTTRTFSTLPPLPLTPRAGHSATLLTDGRLLIVGGVNQKGEALTDFEIWNPATNSTDRFSGSLSVARYQHSAILLPDGTVLILGGKGSKREAMVTSELFNPKTQRFSVTTQTLYAAFAGSTSPALAASMPANGAGAVSVDIQPALRMNRPLDGKTTSSATLTLVGPQGNVATKVITAEAGMLAFITPQQPLKPGTEYRLLLNAPMDTKGYPLTGSPIRFVTEKAGAQSSQGKKLLLGNIRLANLLKSADEASTATSPSPIGANARTVAQIDVVRPPLVIPKPLMAAAGVTAISGVVMTLDGEPLANVHLSAEFKKKTVRAHTDRQGRFLLAGLSAGHYEVFVDARPAGSRDTRYGTFVVGVDAKAGKTNVLPYIMWMPEIDSATEITLPSPTTKEVVLTSPKIPGMEVHIPAGTIIKDHDGKIVTKLSLTPIPVDRTPFPIPNSFAVPVYFTVQPGGAKVYNAADGSWALVRVIYPNYTHRAAGMAVDFWHYEPDGEGWYVYGRGAVNQSGTQVVPDPGVGIYEFTGAMLNTGNIPPPSGPPPGGGGGGGGGPGGGGRGGPPGGGGGPPGGPSGPPSPPPNAPPDPPQKPSGGAGDPCSSGAGDPVDTATGLFIYQHCDLVLRDTWPLRLTRTFRQNDTRSRPFGIGMTHDYEMFLWSANQYQEADLILPDGGRVHYVRISPGTGWSDAEFESTSTPTRYYRSRIKYFYTNGGSPVGWNLTLTDGTVYVFGDVTPMQSMRDRFGNTVTLTRTPAQTGNITRIDGPNGRYIVLEYDAANHVTKATDNMGRAVRYEYDLLGRMTKVTFPDGSTNLYGWATCPSGPITDVCTQLFTITDGLSKVALTNEYTAGRVTKQTYVDSSTNLFAYTLDATSKITQADVTDQLGRVRRILFNSAGFVTSSTAALGTPQQQTYLVTRAATGHLVTDVTDPLGRVSRSVYDTMGNVTSSTFPYGTAQALTTSYTYEPLFQQVKTVTDPLGHITTFNYDVAGYLVGVKDANNNEVVITNNISGQPLTITDPLGHMTAFEYDGADLVKATDALNRVMQRFTDAVGRVVGITDPLGNVTRLDYDAFDRLLKQTDAHGNVVESSYDLNGNRLTFKDPRGNLTQYAYDDSNRMTSRTNPLLKVDSFIYDAGGKLLRATDRKGQVMGYSYDPLDRATQVGFGATASNPTAYQSTITYGYDAGNRLLTLTDSANGTITRGYDSLDRRISETTAQGVLNYTYDNASRRATLQAPAQAQVVYAYDNANRLTGITQGTQSVTIGYDNANRRTSLTLPNGINLTYGYDNANQLTGITYKKGTVTLGDLTYGYDLAGRRTNQGGSFARTGLPVAQTANSHDANNRLTLQDATALSYDDNGNLFNDGINTYSWNSRDQLIAIAGPVAASFQYDAVGRRKQKTVAGTTRNYLYDGLNIVQEQSSTGSVIADHLTSLGIDEVFTRTESRTTKTLLRDALGSTIAMADSTGIVTSWTYDPYGKATYTGVAQSNPFLYTGRELDGTGLYYYRARYYHPTLNRFIAEDPIGFGGGANIYAYVGGNPVTFTDPRGEFIVPIAVGVASLVGGYFAGDMIGGIINNISNLMGNKTSADNLADYSKMMTGACLNGNVQACGAMENFERQRKQCINGALNDGANLSNVPSGGPLGSEIRNSGIQIGRQR